MLVTGASGGIGRATCTALRRAGAEVIGADLDVTGCADLCEKAFTLDVTDDASVATVAGRVGPLDALVLSHGITALGPALSTPTAAVDRVIAVNLRGAIAVTQAVLPGLVERRGRIGVLSSVSGFAPLVHRTAYAASKHGLHGYFDSLRSEVVQHGVSVTLVAPSFVATGIETRAAHRAGGSAGEWSTTGEVSSAESTAAALVQGMRRRRTLVLPSRTARLAYVASRATPGLYAMLMRRRVLSSAADQ